MWGLSVRADVKVSVTAARAWRRAQRDVPLGPLAFFAQEILTLLPLTLPIWLAGVYMARAGNAYVTGYTCSTDFPTVNLLEATNHGNYNGNAFVARLNAAGLANASRVR